MRAIQLSKEILSKEIVIDQGVAKIFTMCCFMVFTALGAYVRIPLPFTPVPITLQTFFVLLSGAVLGSGWGAASQIGYLLLGIAGLPVFTEARSGIATIFGPTGGYLIGFVVSSWVVGKLMQRKAQSNTRQIVWTMMVGSLVGIYLFGVLGLSLFLKCNLYRALSLGFFPFIFGDVIKIISAGLIFGKIKKRSR